MKYHELNSKFNAIINNLGFAVVYEKKNDDFSL